MASLKYQMVVHGSCKFIESPSEIAIGNGGYGVVVKDEFGKKSSASGLHEGITNARMDILGIIEGLKFVEDASSVTVYLSNQNIIDSIEKKWLDGWAKNNFRKKIRNIDLWKELSNTLKQRNLSISLKNSRDLEHSIDLKEAIKLSKGENDFCVENNDNIFEFDENEPILESISVDASCLGNPGVTEYRGVDTKTKHIIFEKRYESATNNIGEFLAIVHALAHCKVKNLSYNVLYTDSETALAWVRNKKTKSKLIRTEANTKLFDDISRAEKWLIENKHDFRILKWKTEKWGEIPADFGRK